MSELSESHEQSNGEKRKGEQNEDDGEGGPSKKKRKTEEDGPEEEEKRKPRKKKSKAKPLRAVWADPQLDEKELNRLYKSIQEMIKRLKIKIGSAVIPSEMASARRAHDRVVKKWQRVCAIIPNNNEEWKAVDQAWFDIGLVLTGMQPWFD
jgi:hypothetical protein